MEIGAYQKELFAHRCDDLVSSASVLLESSELPPEVRSELSRLRDLATSAAEKFRQVPKPCGKEAAK